MEKREIRFDGWCVNFESGEITKGGETHRLQDQPLQILDELTQRPGEVVTREQLIARLWPKGVVEFDTGLNTAMRKLRIALGDDADTPRYIETIPRKGYRFIGVLETTAVPTVPELPSLPSQYVPTSFETGDVIGRRASDRQAPLKRLAWGFGSILVAAVLAVVAWNMPGKLFQVDPPEEKLPTIVVLPLVDMSVDQNEQSLCDGLTEELSNWLAHIPTLRVVARTSAFAFKGTNTDVREIGRQLGATHVLEGSLRRSGNQMRITVQLIEATHGLHIWSDTYDMPIGDIFLIEDTVSRSVAEQLHLTLSADTAEQWAQRQPEKMEAYELYLLGRARQRKRTADDNLKAAEFFRRAVAADPQYALAQVGLAETLLNGLSLNRAPLEDVSAEAEPLINRALSLSPNLPDALAVKGWLLTEEFKLDEALPLLQRATKANPERRLQPPLPRQSVRSPRRSELGVEPLLRGGRARSARFHLARVPLPGIHRPRRTGPRTPGLSARPRTRSGTTCGDHSPRHGSPAPRVTPTSARALARRGAQARTRPTNGPADQIIELLVTQKKMNEARALLPDLPGAGGFFALSREASVVLAEKGAAGLRAWMAENEVAGKAITGAELTELARLQYLAGDATAARATLAHAQRILPLSSADLFDGSQIRHEYSASLFHAGIELQGRRRRGAGPGAARPARPDAGHLREEWRAALRAVLRCAPRRWRCRARKPRPRLR